MIRYEQVLACWEMSIIFLQTFINVTEAAVFSNDKISSIYSIEKQTTLLDDKMCAKLVKMQNMYKSDIFILWKAK